MDYEKLEILYTDKRVQPRSKLVFRLLENGLALDEIINFPADGIRTLKGIRDGERFFMAYAKGAGVVERIAQSGLLFPGTEGNPMKETSVLTFLRRACRINGFQLHEIGFEGLVEQPTIIQGRLKKKTQNMSFNDVISFIENQNK